MYYDWDQPDTETTFRIGRLTRLRDSSGTTLFGYDHRGNLTSQRQRLVGTADWVWLRYGYDRADRVVRVTYPSGRQVAYLRDGKGRVLSVRTRASTAVTAWTTLAANLAYEPFGPVRTLGLGNGLVAANDWGNDGRLASRRLTRAVDNTALSQLGCSYDADDNITAITDGLAPANDRAMDYDPAGRLARLDLASGAVRRTDWGYDANGNRLTEARRAVPTDAAPLESDGYAITPGTNRLASVTTAAGTRSFGYDARGNTASETRPGGVTLSTAYDGYARLTGYTRSDAAPLSFQYNGRDDRVAMTRGSGGAADTRRFVYDPGGRVLGEYGASAADVKAEFIWALPQVGAGSPFGGDDALGGYMPLAVATPDNAGTVVLNWVHGGHLGVPLLTTDATGAPSTTPNDYLLPGFPGQSRVLADLYYNRYRDYDPTTGRYIQADPIGLGGGSNVFAYAGNNPVNAETLIGTG